MKMLISQIELLSLKSRSPVPLKCENCEEIFYKGKNNVLSALKGHPDFALKFCSLKCHYLFQSEKNWTIINCSECGKSVRKQKSKIKANNFSFCSRSCSAKFQNKRKTLGSSRKSKSEIYLIELIKRNFKKLTVLENVRDILPSNLEIDIFLPSLELAVEVNGILHYFPVYGQKKLETIRLNDSQKIIDAQNIGCKLIVIDISRAKYWKETKSLLELEYTKVLKPHIEKLLAEKR